MNPFLHLSRFPQTKVAAACWKRLGRLNSALLESQYCVFRSGRERFCLPVLDVEEVLDWPLLTKVPLSPAYLHWHF